MKISTELKILISLVLVAVGMWLVFSMGDNMGKAVTGVITAGPNANMDHLDPIYTNALVTAGTYEIISKNLSQEDVSKMFWNTYLGKNVKSVKILKKVKLNKEDLKKAFQDYTFVNSNSLAFLEKAGYVGKNVQASQLNSRLLNYNKSTIQTMLSVREGIPQFVAYKLETEFTFDNGKSEKRNVIVMRVISSATGQPYKHLRWAVSKVYQ